MYERNGSQPVSKPETNFMKKGVAEKLLSELVVSTRALDSAEVIARDIEDESEQMYFRRAIARAGLSVYADVMHRIFDEFPDLRPDDEARDK